MKQTEKLALNLFEGSDPVRVGPVNENTERIEEALDENAWKVGDIRDSLRSDLGEEWALTNGDVVVEGDYPEYEKVAPDVPYNVQKLTTAGKQFTFSTGTVVSNITGYLEVNGYQVIAINGGYPNGMCIAWSKDDFETYTITKICSMQNGNLRYNIQPNIFYANGYYFVVAFGISYASDLTIYYTDDIESTEWTLGTTGTDDNESFTRSYDLWYADGKYFLACGRNPNDVGSSAYNEATANQPTLVVSDTPDFATHTKYDIATEAIGTTSFVRNEEYCVYLCTKSTSTAVIYYALMSDPITWYRKDISIQDLGASSGGGGSTLAIHYFNGIYAFVTYFASTDLYGNILGIVWTDDIQSTTWNVTPILDAYNPSSNSGGSQIIFLRGQYYVIPVNQSMLSISTNKNIRWHMGPSLESSDDWTYFLNSCQNITSAASFGGYIHPIITSSGYLRLFSDNTMYDIPIFAVPISSGEDCYRYIKIKESEDA